jgi:gliding motility-associated-like protein
MKLFYIQFICKLFIIPILLFLNFNSHAQWRQFGEKIVDTLGNRSFVTINYGLSVAISPDGTTFIGGATDTNKGAWVYSINGTNLIKVGNITIPGTRIISNGSEFGQGQSVGISSDNHTFLIGYPKSGDEDHGIPNGTSSVATFNGSTFIAVGSTFNGKDHNRNAISTIAGQGKSVSMSGDGKVMIIGAHGEDGTFEIGSAWIFTFNGSNYLQLGEELIGSGVPIGTAARQGYSVGISKDGKTAIVGGIVDAYSGAAWIFTFNGTSFIQVGSKLKGTGTIGASSFGSSVSISADGKTAIIGGYLDNDQVGAAWIFSFNGTNFIQIGDKLIANDFAKPNLSISNPSPRQGNSVCISGDGQTAIVGALYDSLYTGAAWIYTFNGTNFKQAGPKMIGTGSTGKARQGNSVSLSHDGTRAIVAGIADNNGIGAAWVFVKCSPPDIISQCIDSNNVITVQATSLFPITYQWYQDTQDSVFAITTTSSYNLSPYITTNGDDFFTAVLTQEGCILAAGGIDIKQKYVIHRPIFGDSIICKGEALNLEAGNIKTITWSTGDTLPNISFIPLKDTTVSFIGVNKQNCPVKDMLTVTVTSLTPVSINLSSINHPCDSLNSLVLSGGFPVGGNYTYLNAVADTFNISKSGDYPIVYNRKDINQCLNTALGVLSVIHCDICDTPNPPCTCPGLKCVVFKIYSSFTPNNDDLNDTWVIDVLPKNNKLVIVDKWGIEVYRAEPYNNDWDGSKNGKQLPDGVYYYLFNNINDNKKYAGNVSILY